MLNELKNILAIGAHPDDIELSCLGTLLKLKKEFNSQISYLVCSYGEKKSEAKIRELEQRNVAKAIGVQNLSFMSLPDTELQYHQTDIISEIERLVRKFNIDLVLTHSMTDHHQDHIAVNNASRAALRRYSGTILLYPSFGHLNADEFNLFVDISSYIDKKVDLLSNFRSQSMEWYMNSTRIVSVSNIIGAKVGFDHAEAYSIYSSSL